MLSMYDPDGHLPSGIDRSVVALDRLRSARRVPKAQHAGGLGNINFNPAAEPLKDKP